MADLPIETDEEHSITIKEVEVLWGAKPGTPEGERLDALLTLADAYETKRWPHNDTI